MSYTLHSYGEGCTSVTAPDMLCALGLYLVVHPTDDFVVISHTHDGDDIRDRIVYMPPGEGMQHDTVAD